MKRDEEIWRDIEGYEGLYQVSSLGRLRNRYGLILKQKKNERGYCYFSLCKSAQYKNMRVHRLVAKAFVPNPGNLPQVNHIDGNKENNAASNLEWVTNEENRRQARWLTRKIRGGAPVMCVESGIRFMTVTDAARYYGMHQTEIYRALRSEDYTAHGLHFRKLKEDEMDNKTFFRLDKCIDGEKYPWGFYGISEIDALVQAAWQFGKSGIPVSVTETDSDEEEAW